MPMQVDLVAVERALWSGEATMVIARTTDGEIGVLPGHTPLLAALEPGWVVRIVREGEDDLTVAIHGGFLSVREDGVSILAEMAELASEIDVARAQEALERAQRAVETDEDTDECEAARDRALGRLRAAGQPA
jgi:F-type H+-transporting ATPase subunit epsilon